MLWHNNPMSTMLASGPVELFSRIDNESMEQALLQSGAVMTTIDSVVNWGRKNSIWPMAFGLACCAIEMMSMSASRFDISRFGAEVFRGSPRQSAALATVSAVTVHWTSSMHRCKCGPPRVRRTRAPSVAAGRGR